MKKENGAIMVEGTIILAVVVFVLMILMDFGFLMYHKYAVTKTANEVAADVANVYAHPEAEPYIGYIDLTDFTRTNLYRHFNTLIHNQDKLITNMEKKAKWYACYRISKDELWGSTSSFSDIKAKVLEKAGLGRCRLQVTVKRKYKVLSLSLFKFFGLDPEYTCEATGYADCVDPIDYINNTNMRKELIEKYLGTINKWLKNILGVIENISNLFS